MEADDDPIALTVVGDRVALGPLRRDLIAVYHRWFNDLTTSRTLGLSWPTTIEQETATYERRATADNAVYFTVYEHAVLRPIGIAYLYEIEPRHGRASFGITIGEPDCRGKGYGTEATHLTLDHAFTVLGLENVMLTVLEFNRGGLRAYQKAGFHEFGRRRRCSRLGGRLWDLIYMECLADEFERPVTDPGLPPGHVLAAECPYDRTEPPASRNSAAIGPGIR